MSLSINFVHLGIRNDLPFDVSKRVQIVNISASLAVFTAAIFVISYLPSFIALCSLCFLILFALTWAFNKQGRYTTAKVCLYIFSILYLFLLASTLGESAAVHFMLVPVVISMLLSFQIKERKWLVLTLLLALCAYLVLEFTDFSLLTWHFFADKQLLWKTSIAITIGGTIVMMGYYIYKDTSYLNKNVRLIRYGQDIDYTVRFFNQSLNDKNTIEEVFWDVAKNCIGKLGFVDCVVYLVDEEKEVLRQVAAFGPKNARDFEIGNPLDIPLSAGIVGACAILKQPVVVNDTSTDPRYIVDDQARRSELAVPLIYKGKIIGVIDSEHPEKDFFDPSHVKLLQTIAQLCTDKVGPLLATHNNHTSGPKPDNIDQHFLKQLETTILQSIDQADLSGEFLARKLGISRMQLHRKVTHITGCSPGEFVRQLRLKKAAELLSRGEVVSQAAYAAGFSSLSHFSKAFKAQWGVPPSTYRHANGKTKRSTPILP